MRRVDRMTMKSTGKKMSIGRLFLTKSGKPTLFGLLDGLRSIVVGLFLAALSQSVYAITDVEVTNADGEVVFLLRFFDQADGQYATGYTATRGMTANERAAVVEAAQYWVDILKAHGTMPRAQVQTQVRDENGDPLYNEDGSPVVETVWVNQPVVVNIGYDEANAGNAGAASMGSVKSEVDGYYVDRTQALLADGTYTETGWLVYDAEKQEWVGEDRDMMDNGAHAFITVGSGWNIRTGNQSQTGRGGNDLVPVIIHEFGHALGIASSAGSIIDPVTYETSFRFSSDLTRYDSRLRDNNGNRTTPSKSIGYDDTEGKQSDKIFDMGDPDAPLDFQTGKGNPSHVTFVGKNTLELWYGKDYDKLTEKQKNNGVPIQGYTYNIDPNYPHGDYDGDGFITLNDLIWTFTSGGSLSHINTTNSLMSWQAYRNYSGFIEIELAVMQDLGYTVERRNFFGKSFYADGDGETPFNNSTSFAFWDAAKQAYDLSKPNDAAYAIGAHLFAKNLNIFQTGSIWANGPGSAGVRIDGSNNQFTLMDKTSIRADGRNGYGILTSYGINHTVTLQKGSSVSATGVGGIGVAFDFGEPVVGDKRGSYHYGAITTETGAVDVSVGYLPELYGSLVNDFNVSGSITGSVSRQVVSIENWWAVTNAYHEDSRTFNHGAAIYIDETAAVDRINIMDGASITGNILSNRGAVSVDILNEDTGMPISVIPRTEISFGYKADANGNATAQADNDFKFTLKDNINYFRYEIIPRIHYLDVDRVDHENKLVYIPLGEAQGNGFHPGDIDLDDIDIDEDETDVDLENTLPDDQGYWVSPAYNSDDVFWHFVLWDDGFYDYQFAGGNVSATIVRPGDGKVYADILTDGWETTTLHFAGGITEFMGNSAYVMGLTVDKGATLTLTPGEPNTANSYIEIDGEYYTIYSEADPVIKIPEIHIDAHFDLLPVGTTQINTAPPTIVNSGRVSGDGAFYLGMRSYSWDENMEELHGLIGVNSRYWNGTFRNEGTIAPGGNDGEDIGIILIQGDLEFTKNGIYEVTIGGEREERFHSGILKDGKYVDQFGIIYDKEIGQYRGENTEAFVGTGNDLIVVANNTKMDGTLKVNVLPDSIFGNETTVHTIIQSGSFTSGSSFTNIVYDQAFLAVWGVEINPYNPHEAQIKIIRDLDFFEERAKTKNETAVAKAVDNSLFDDARLAFSLGDRRNSDADIRNVLHQMGAAHRANSALINLWTPSELLFNRIGWGNGQMSTDDRGRVDWDRITRRKARMLGQSPYRQRTGSLWGDYFNTQFNAEGDGNSDKYNISRNGFMVGCEWNLTPYSAIGAIAAYADNKLKQSGDTVKSDDYMLGLYFVFAPMNEFEFKGYIGTGFQEYDFNRHVRNANIYTDSLTDARGIYDRYVADTKGNTLNVSLELARPLMLHPTFILRPTLGIDSQFMWQNGFSENKYDDSYGSHLYALNYKRMKFDRSLLRAGFSSETTGSRGGIRMRAFYVTRIHGDDCPTSDVRFVAGGDQFGIQGVKIGSNFLNLGVGTNLWLDGEKTCSFFLDYDANIYNTSRKLDVHTFSVGLLQNF